MTSREHAMQSADVLSILRSAGLPIDGTTADDEEAIPAFDTFRDPEATVAVGRALARRVTPLRPDVLVVWDDPDECVLAHVVGLELGTRWVRAYDESGVVRLVGDLGQVRAVLLADAFRTGYRVRALAELVTQQGGSVVGAAALVATRALDEAAKALGLTTVTVES